MKIETHLHTSESSPCASIPAREMVHKYVRAGYDIVVVTDHYNDWARQQFSCDTWEDYARQAVKGYQAACEAVRNEQLPLRILYGVEIALSGSPNDYLVYGATPEWLSAHPDVCTLSLKELSELVHCDNMLLFQAHPFRTYCTPADPQYLDGAERYNGNPRHDNRNDQASAWIDAHGLSDSSGSDFHDDGDEARGGIITQTPVHSEAELAEVYRSGTYRLIRASE